jgi:hypothetical protein
VGKQPTRERTTVPTSSQASQTKNGDAPVHIECAEGSTIEIEVPGVCTLKFGEQTPQKGVHFTGTGSGSSREVTNEVTVSGLTYTKVGGLSCAFAGDGKSAHYEGNVTTKGYEDKGSALTGTEKTTPNYSEQEGKQIGLFVTST